MRLISLKDMRTGARRLADLEFALQRFPDSEVTVYVNQGLAKVYKELVSIADFPWFVNQAPDMITTGNMQVLFPLPADCMQVIAVMWAQNIGGPVRILEPYTEAERTELINAAFYGMMWPSKYGITGGPGATTSGSMNMGNSLEILPASPAGGIIRVRYIPSPPKLVNDTDTFDGVLGWEDAAMTWAAILMRRKDDLDTADLERDYGFHIDHLRTIAKRRDRSRPPRISIVRNNSWRRTFRRVLP